MGAFGPGPSKCPAPVSWLPCLKSWIHASGMSPNQKALQRTNHTPRCTLISPPVQVPSAAGENITGADLVLLRGRGHRPGNQWCDREDTDCFKKRILGVRESGVDPTCVFHVPLAHPSANDQESNSASSTCTEEVRSEFVK